MVPWKYAVLHIFHDHSMQIHKPNNAGIKRLRNFEDEERRCWWHVMPARLSWHYRMISIAHSGSVFGFRRGTSDNFLHSSILSNPLLYQTESHLFGSAKAIGCICNCNCNHHTGVNLCGAIKSSLVFQWSLNSIAVVLDWICCMQNCNPQEQ